MIWVWVLLSCGGTTSDTGVHASETIKDTGIASDCEDGWDGWAAGFFRTYCAACHARTSANRHGAPESVAFDSIEDLRGQADRVRARVLDDQTMPVGGGVNDEALDRLDRWLDCLADSS